MDKNELIFQIDGIRVYLTGVGDSQLCTEVASQLLSLGQNCVSYVGDQYRAGGSIGIDPTNHETYITVTQ
jgi:hypothetical protein